MPCLGSYEVALPAGETVAVEPSERVELPKPLGAVLIAHGLSGPRFEFAHLAEALAALTRPLVGARLAPRVAYMGFHLVVQLRFCVASIVVWHSFVAHTAFIVVIVGVAVHNGSTYTFRVFATRYADELVDKHPHILAD